MRQALEASVARQRQGGEDARVVPAPVGGWNTLDSLADMAANEASVIDNWYCRASEVVQRGGSLNWATGMTGVVRTIFDYTPKSGTAKLYGVTDAGIYDITAGGAVGAVVKALTNGYYNSITITNSAGTSYSFGLNGTDAPVLFDGTTWTNPAITGPGSSNNLVWPWLTKHRIFMVEKNSMNVWYLAIDSIQGAASQLPLGNLFKKGGSIQSGTAWTLDSGDGPDDLWAIVTSEGEMAIYQGTDPSSASAWAIVGVYFVGRPLGRRCFAKFGGDVVILTENGVFPLSKILTTGGINYAEAFSHQVQPSFTGAVVAGGITTQGWEACVYPSFDALICNIMPPTSQLVQNQYVMNTITGKWSSFSAWSARCFHVFVGQLYYGDPTGKVIKAWDAAGQLVNDNGTDITTTCHTAYNAFGSIASLKHIDLFRTLLAYSGSVDVRWGVSADFVTPILSSFVPRGSSTIGSPWDTSSWDTSVWSPDTQRYKIWRASAHPPGYMLSLWLQTIGNNGSLSWAGTDYLLGRGGLL